MQRMYIKTLLKNPWFISLTSGIILILTGYIINPIRLFFEKKLQCLFTQRVEIKLWLLIILLSFLIILIVLNAKKVFNRKPKYLDYRKDIFFELNWQWSYGKKDKKYFISNLSAYCPNHEIELIENYAGGIYECPYEACDYNVDYEAVQYYYTRVEKIIENKIGKEKRYTIHY